MTHPQAAAQAPSRSSRKYAIIGGRLEDDNRRIYREMRRLCRGRILILPTASSEPEEVGEETLEAFRTHGFVAEVLPIYSTNQEQTAFDPEIVAKIAEFGNVYFTGGDQAKIFGALLQNGEATPALKAIRKAHRDGGLLAGSSAGAAMMSDPMILGGTSFEAMFHGLVEDPEQPGLLLGDGLGFFKHGLVDQHFIKRGRLARMVVAMAESGNKRGFGIDENTALIIDGKNGYVVGEYGVFYIDTRRARLDPENHSFEDFRLSYLDDGDSITLPTGTIRPSETKRRVRKNEVAYRAPARSQRNAFGAYAIYDLVARLVLGDQLTYSADSLLAVDPKTEKAARLKISRKRGASRCLISPHPDGMRMTAINLRASLTREELTPDLLKGRDSRGIRTFGMDLNERSQIILLGSSPLYSAPEIQAEIVNTMGPGPIGVFAAASAEARRTAEDHVEFFRKHNVEAVDLGITIDTVEYAERNPDMLDRIASMKAIFLCGGNQVRLVETLLHRGEESAVLRAIAKAYSNGATLIASSGAVSALSRIMIAGGTSFEAIRYGVTSDMGHPGLVIHEGIGLFGSAIADQNIISAKRLARLVVACAEESERYGIGVCDESAVVATKSGIELTAAGRYGFIQVDTERVDVGPFEYGFVAKGVKLRMFAPGDKVNLNSGHIERHGDEAAAAETFSRLIDELQQEDRSAGLSEQAQGHRATRHSPTVKLWREGPLSATLDLECPREEFARG